MRHAGIIDFFLQEGSRPREYVRLCSKWFAGYPITEYEFILVADGKHYVGMICYESVEAFSVIGEYPVLLEDLCYGEDIYYLSAFGRIGSRSIENGR
jgi:hypothetical protein